MKHWTGIRTLFLAITAIMLLEACGRTVVVGTATGARVAHDRRTAGTVVDDQLIEFKAYARIRKRKDIKKRVHVNITSYNHIVLLTGEVPSLKLKTIVEDIVRSVPKVRRIQNELVIGPLTSRGSRLRDTWITTKAKTSLFKIRKKGFNPTRIKVVTENKTVFLMGLVKPDEADAAVRVVREVSGVRKVVKVFEYLR